MAQERVALRTDLTFYADNTEFSNSFRDGATLFGTALTVAVDVVLDDRVTFSGGVFTNHRFGSKQFIEQWRPVLKLDVHSDHQHFIIGTLDTVDRADGIGPDRAGLHGLLPPLQNETLAFTRPYEAGVQWKLNFPRIRQDAWINWQKLNTAEHRERFDAGVNGRLPLDTAVPVAIAYQFHVVHEGGELFHEGPVRDSWALGPGVIVEPRVWRFDRTVVEGYLLFSRHVLDRSSVNESSSGGHGIFVRLSGEKNGWRGHLISWGASGWIKDESDGNYGSRWDGGTRFRRARRYGEVGLTKVLYESDGVEFEGSARVPRIEKDYEYSYRVLARVDFNFPVWAR